MKKILLIEDDMFLAKVYELKLRELGYEPAVMKDGVDAVKTALEIKPDLILLDLMMPNINGFEALQELRSEKTMETVPILILSNLSQNPDIERTKKLGATDYMVKSDKSFQEVTEKIKSLIGSAD